MNEGRTTKVNRRKLYLLYSTRANTLFRQKLWSRGQFNGNWIERQKVKWVNWKDDTNTQKFENKINCFDAKHLATHTDLCVFYSLSFHRPAMKGICRWGLTHSFRKFWARTVNAQKHYLLSYFSNFMVTKGTATSSESPLFGFDHRRLLLKLNTI